MGVSCSPTVIVCRHILWRILREELGACFFMKTYLKENCSNRVNIWSKLQLKLRYQKFEKAKCEMF